MTFDFRYPNLTGATEKEQLQQMKTYIHQLVDELKWALNAVDPSQVNYVVVHQKQQGNGSNGGVSTIGVDELDDDSTQAQFNALKPLIIKSADIVNAYYDVINKRLEGLYVAQSEFGTFMEQTSQDIEATSTDITQAFVSVQSIDENMWLLDSKLDDAKSGIDTNFKALSDDIGQLDSGIKNVKESIDKDITDIKKAVNNIDQKIIDVKSSIKSGLLDYDNGVPIYGLEVGQTNVIDGVEVFRKYARFTASRLSFYDQNNIEVAYISDRKLYINNVEITVSYKIGGLLDKVTASWDVVTKWVGRG